MSKLCLIMVAVVMSCVCSYAAPSSGNEKSGQSPVFQIRDRSEEPLLRSDKPWEDYCIAGGTVIREGERWRMWYGAYDHNYRRDDDACLCYAESPDGVHWTKPNLGLVEYGGNKENNILLAGPQCGGFAFSYVFVDDGKPAHEKYKMIWQRFHEGEQAWQVYGATSADGMHWSLLPKPLSPKNSDTSTICIPDGGKYRLYTRIWRGGWSGVRTVGYTESDHFGDFPDPVEIFSHDDQDPEGMQFYSNAATKLGDGFYVMFPAAFYTKNQTVRSHLAWSRDGIHFTRYGREPVVDVGKQFDRRGVYVGAGAVPGDAANTWWFYYLGTNAEHDAPPELTGSQNGIGRFLLEVEGMPKQLEGSRLPELPDMYYADTDHGAPFAKDPDVVRFGERYLMYYTVRFPERIGIGIAESSDLTHWRKVAEIDPAGDLEKKGLGAPAALVYEDRLHLFYQTYGNGPKDALCHAVSEDGVRFERDPTNPIFAPTGDWTVGRAIDAEVFVDGPTAFLYGATRDPDMKRQMLFVATAPVNAGFTRDSWTQRCDGPILAPELPWETRCIEAPSVVKHDGRYFMFYAGGYNNDPQQIGVAASDNGVAWKRLSDKPLLPNGPENAWNHSESGHPGVFVDNNGDTWLFFQGNNDHGKTWFLSKMRVAWTPEGLPYLIRTEDGREYRLS